MKKAPAKKAAPAKKIVAKAAAPNKAAAKPNATHKKVETKKPAPKPAPKKEVAKPAAAKKQITKTLVPVKTQPVKKTVSKPVKPTVVSKALPVSKTGHTAVKPTSPKDQHTKPTGHIAPTPPKPVAKKETHKHVVPEKDNGPIKTVSRKTGKAEALKEVKIPKTSVKTSVPYKPGYTPLEKRNEEKSGDLLVRYTDTELNEFRELIMKKLEAAKKELAYLQGLITRKDDMGGDETDNRYMTMEDGGMSIEREQLSQMASRQITYIDHLEKANIRIENKTYGICRVTGKLIDKTRLRAVPHATLSLEAKLGLAKPILNTP
ncbi:MAG: TraR/DksA C4-type zinc finger protein [Chitinophagaceae bacterium]